MANNIGQTGIGGSSPGVRLPFDQGFAGDTSPGAFLPFDQGFTGQQSPGALLPFDPGFPGQQQIPPQVDIKALLSQILGLNQFSQTAQTGAGQAMPQEEIEPNKKGIFQISNPNDNFGFKKAVFKRTKGTPGTLDGIHEAADEIAALFSGKRPSAIGPGLGKTRDEILEMLFAQVAEEKRQAERDAMDDVFRKARHGL